MPILRNHRHIFTIKEVKGPGFLTVEEALGSPENHTNLHNIVVTPIVIDEAFTDITFNAIGLFSCRDLHGDDAQRQARQHKHAERILQAYQLHPGGRDRGSY